MVLASVGFDGRLTVVFLEVLRLVPCFRCDAIGDGYFLVHSEFRNELCDSCHTCDQEVSERMLKLEAGLSQVLINPPISARILAILREPKIVDETILEVRKV